MTNQTVLPSAEEAEAKCRKDIKVAVRNLISRAPVLAMMLIEKLSFVTDWDHQSCWVNGKQLGYNPIWLAQKTLEEIVFLIAHEVLHCVLKHPLRRGNRHHMLWNISCDFAINLLLVEYGFGKFVEGGMIDERFKGLTAEQIYDILLKEIGQPPPPPGPGEEEGENKTEAEEKIEEMHKKLSDSTGEVHDTPEPQPSEEQEGETEKDGDVQFGSAQSEYDPNKAPVSAQVEIDEGTDWDQAMTRALTTAKKSCGEGSVKIGRAIKQARKVPVDVVAELEDFMTRPTRSDPDWMRPKRRLVAHDPTWWFPGKGGYECGDLCAGMDESGSVSDPEIRGLCSIFSHILERHPAEDLRFWLIHFDHEVTCAEVFTKKDLPIEYERKSFGGTCFDSVVDWVNNKREDEEDFNPECLIFLTDLCAPPPDHQDYPMMWISTEFHHPLQHKRFPGDVHFFPQHWSNYR